MRRVEIAPRCNTIVVDGCAVAQLFTQLLAARQIAHSLGYKKSLDSIGVYLATSCDVDRRPSCWARTGARSRAFPAVSLARTRKLEVAVDWSTVSTLAHIETGSDIAMNGGHACCERCGDAATAISKVVMLGCMHACEDTELRN